MGRRGKDCRVKLSKPHHTSQDQLPPLVAASHIYRSWRNNINALRAQFITIIMIQPHLITQRLEYHNKQVHQCLLTKWSTVLG